MMATARQAKVEIGHLREMAAEVNMKYQSDE
jgi:hypothetical protein